MKKRMVRPAILFCLTVVIVIMVFNACSKSNDSGNNGGTTSTGSSVSIKGFAFSVSSLTVNTGTKVTWTNNDAVAHTVTADDGSFDSGNIASGGTFSKTFTTAGTYAYHCSIHTSMTAKIMAH